MANALDFLLNLRANTSGFNQGVDGAKFAVNALVGALAAVGVGLGIKELAHAADSYTNLSTQVQIATKEGGNFTQAMAGVHQIALQTNSNLDATAGLFTRLNTVGKEIGLTQQNALDMTRTVTQAIQMGGGSAQASEAAVTQFIQAMQGGVLRGEEFNSIMKNGFGLAEALAKGLGRSTTELRAMAEAGELTAERVIKALESQKDAINQTYAQLPTTIGNAIQRIQTSWQIVIGEMDQASGASAQVAKWLVYVADNLDIVKTYLDDVGEGLVWFGSQLAKIDSSDIDALKTALSSTYDVVKNLIASAADIGVAIKDGLDTALSSVLSFTDSWRGANEQVSGFRKALDLLNVGFSALSDGISAISIGVDLFIAALYNLAADFEKVRSVLTWGDVRESAIANMNAMQAKMDEYLDSAERKTLAFESKTIAALDNISKTEAEKNQQRIADNEATFTKLSEQEQSYRDAYKAISDERIQLEQALNEARKSGDQEAVDQALSNISALEKREQEWLKQSQDTAKAKVQAAQEIVDATIDGGVAIDDATKKTLLAKVEAQGLALAFDGVGKAIVKAMEPASNSLEGLANAAVSARKAADALKLDLYELKNGITESFNTASKQVTIVAKNIESLGFTGERATAVIYEAWQKWLETAKSQAEIDFAKQKLIELGEKGQLSTEQVRLGMEAIKAVVRELPAELTEVEKAFERLGIKTKEQLKLQADLALADFETVRQSGQATQADLQAAYEKTVKLAHASGDAQSIAMANAKAASLGLQVQVSETGNVSVQSMNEVANAVERVGHSARNGGADGFREMGRVAREEAKSSIDAWNDALTAQQKAEAETSKNNGPKGGAVNSMSKADIESELQSRGYSARDAKKYAESLFIQGLDADKAVMSKNLMNTNGQYANKAFQDLHNQGLTSNYGTAKINELLAQFAVGSTSTTSTNPEKLVKYELTLGSNRVELTGTASQEDSMNAILSELEEIKSRT